MSWFESMTGCTEISPEQVRTQLEIDKLQLRSRRNGCSWYYGELEVLTVARLRERAHGVSPSTGSISIREVVADVRQLHADKDNSNVLFQVASQFNLLEMVSPDMTPECGVGIYEEDHTQGPACAIAAGAGTIYRNYFVVVNERIGQTADNQIDCLSGISELLGNHKQRLWQMVNGYALPTMAGLAEINERLVKIGEDGRDSLRQALQIGIHWDTQVTLGGCSHLVSQAFCSAMPVAYTRLSSKLWEPCAKLILEAAYEATICAGILNKARNGCNRLYLTLLGGGAFGNRQSWILDAIRRAIKLYFHCELEVVIVSYQTSNPQVLKMVEEFRY